MMFVSCILMSILCSTFAEMGNQDMHDCDLKVYPSKNCEIHSESTFGSEMNCYTETLSSDFLPKTYNEGRRNCLESVKTLNIQCTQCSKGDVHHFENVQLFENFQSLNVLRIQGCCINKIHRFIFEPLKDLHTFEIKQPRVNKSEIQMIMEESVISQHGTRLDSITISGMGVKSVPKNELCNISFSVDLSNNLLSDVIALNFGDTQQDFVVEFHNYTTPKCGNKIKRLDLSSNKFKTLHNGCFSNLEELRNLSVTQNELSEIQNGAFKSLGKLYYLDLSNNMIRNITSGMWEDLEALHYLNLSPNETTLKSENFRGLERLEYLILDNNHISTIHVKAFAHLHILQYLSLKNNSIDYISSEMFKNVEKLRKLDLSLNKLGGTLNGDKLGNLHSLSRLNLSGNRFETVERFQYFRNLKILDLSNNEISFIENFAFNLTPSIRNLYLDNNQLQIILNSTFYGCNSLKILSVSRNELHNIDPNSFQHMLKLANLTLRGNNLTSLPQFDNGTEILHLDASNNNIESLTEKCLAPHSELKYLNLSYNKLHIFNDEIIAMGKTLRELYLNNNLINTISLNMPLSIHLHTLDLQYNNLKFYGFPITLSSLKSLNLSHNQISLIKTTIYQPFITKQDIYIDLSFNQLQTVPFHYSNLFEIYTSLKNNFLTTVDARYNRHMHIDQSVFSVKNPALQIHYLLEGISLKCDCNMNWLKYTNEREQNCSSECSNFKKIGDLDKLWCNVLVLGSTQDQSRPLLKVKDEEFLCKYGRDKLPLNPTTKNSDNKFNCPEQCNCYVNNNWQNVIAYCSKRKLKEIPTNIHSSSTEIYLDGNAIKKVRMTDFINYTHISKLFINNSEVAFIADSSFKAQNNLEKLYLNDNNLITLSPRTFTGLNNLKTLYLQNNQIKHISDKSFYKLPFLKVIRLNNNMLARFPPFSIKKTPSNVRLTLGRNPWVCDCTENFKKFFISDKQLFAKINDSNRMTCFNNKYQNNSITLDEYFTQYCHNLILPQSLTSIVVPTVVFIAITIIAILVFLYRHEMQVIIYSRYNIRILSKSDNDNPENHNLIYDAFVAYSSLDELFVAFELVPKLEAGDRHFKLCVHQRDFLPGLMITNSIVDGIEGSQRTIVVMSENFLCSTWCRFEFKTAHDKMMQDRRHRLIMLVLGDLPKHLDAEVRLYLKTNTYLHRGDRLFWEKLNYAMPKTGLQEMNETTLERNVTT